MQKSIFNLYKNREVRVFISSTFRDMMAEREYLVKKVFPELCKKYANRGVTITEIDLRWGVLEEDAENGKVIDICLTEIDHSRPYFIGILGERYGWIPDHSEYDKHKKIIENFGWVVKDIENNLSITEMEIQYGVLRNPGMIERSAFFLRDSKNESSIAYKETPGSEEENKLKILKNIIENNRELESSSFNDAAELGKKVFEHLSRIIEADFPLLDEKTKKILPQLNFINARRKVYIKEEKYFGLISDHIKRTSSPIVITGKTGAGASSLLANYLVEYAEKNPDDLLLYNFSNASENSSNYIQVLRRFCEELSGREINLQEEFAENSGEQLKNYLDELITQKAPQNILMVIDGLDEFDNEDNSLLLNWLSYSFDDNAKVIVSCGAGDSLERLKKRRYEVVYITEPDKGAKEKFINDYLSEFSKKLPSKYVEAIVSDDISELPLTLKSFLDELRQFGLHEELDSQIKYYTSADGPVEFFDRLLQRLETDFEENKKGLIEDIFTLLYTSGTGLSETEILSILEIPPLYWTPVYNAIESNILNMNGQLRIAHKYLSDAVKQRYLKSSENQKKISGKIITYFIEDIRDSRAVQEVAHQYILLNDKKGLYDFLSAMETVISLFVSRDNELLLLRYWVWLYPDYSPGGIYSPTQLIDFIEAKEYNFKEAITVITVFGLLFKNLGILDVAEDYFKTVYVWSKKHLDERDDLIRSSLARLVLTNLDLNKIEQAEKYAGEAVLLCDKYLAKEDSNYIAAYSNLGLVLSAKEKYSEAIEIYKVLLEIIDDDETKTEKSKLSILNNLATAYFNNNLIDESIKIYIELINTGENLYGSDHAENIIPLSNLAFIYSQIGKHEEAHEYFNKGIEICTKTYGESHPETISILFNFIGVLLSEGNYDLAGSYLDNIETILKRENIKGEKFGQLLHLRAQLFSSKDDSQKAISFEKDALKIFTEEFGIDHKNTINSLQNLSAYYLEADQLAEAEETIRNTENILLDKSGKKDVRLAEVYNLYGGLYKNKGELGLAEEYLGKGLELRIDILGEMHKDTIKNFQNYAVILIANNKMDRAMEVVEYNLKLSEDRFGKDSIRYCESLELMNEILSRQKEFDALESNLLHIYEFYGKTYGQNHRITYNTLIRLINVKKELGHKEQVLVMTPKAIEIAKSIWDEDDSNYQNLLLDTGMNFANEKEFERAISLFEELYKIQIRNFGKFDSRTILTLNNIAGAKKLNGDMNGAGRDYEELFDSIGKNKTPYNDEILTCLSNYARISHELGDLDKADTNYRSCFENASKIHGFTHETTLDHLNYLGQFYNNTDRFDEAEALYRRYLNNLTSADEETEIALIEVLKLLINLIAPQKDYEALEPLLLRRAGLSEKIYGINSVRTVRVLLVLSVNYQLKEDYQNSVAILNRIAKECTSETLYGSGDEYVQIYNDLITFYNGKDTEQKEEAPADESWKEKTDQNKKLIEQAESEGDTRRTLEILADNIELYEKHQGAEHPDTVFCKRDYANKLIEIDQFEFAGKILEEVLGILKNTLGVNHTEYTLTLYSLAKAQKGLGKFDDALAGFKKVKDQAAAGLESNHPFLYEINKKIADTYFVMFKNEEALRIFNTLLEMIPEENGIERAYIILQIGQLYIRLEMYDDAIKYLSKAEQFYDGQFKENNPYSIMIPDLLAFIYWKKDELEAAEKYYCQAVENARKMLPPEHPAYIKTIKTMALFYFNNNRFSESLTYHNELLNNYIQTYSGKDQIVVEQKLTVALIYHNLEMHREAVGLLKESIEAEPEVLSENAQKMMMNLYNFYSKGD
ncbi:MAG: tetratricopeptide repeat protein [Calditrichaceae bacterium]